MHLACGLGGVLPGKGEIDEVIGLASEAGSAIIPALDDVERYRGQYQAWSACHGIVDA
jgi:hypothetical protein